MPDPTSAEPAPCPDPQCRDAAGRPSLAEPECDGELTYRVCPTCGYEFGWQRAEQPSCAAGIPEAVRRATPSPTPPPLLQIGPRPR